MKDKGFSLIELIVAMAIGAVLLLMLSFMLVQGTKMFNTESDEINLKNDYQIVKNQLDEVFMEAKSLVIVKNAAGQVFRVYTGNVDTDTNELLPVSRAGGSFVEEESSKSETEGETTETETELATLPATTPDTSLTTERIITYDADNGSLYVSSTYATSTSEGNLLSNLITNFDVNVNEKCYETNEDDPLDSGYYTNPLSIIVKLDMKGTQKDVNSEISVRVRNRIKQVIVYTVNDAETSLKDASNVETIKVK